MKSTSARLSLALSLNLLLLSACGGGGSTTAVSADPEPPAPTAATPSPSPAPGPAPGATPSPAPGATPAPSAAGGIALAGSYAPVTLSCAQGAPGFWQRDWTVQFSNGGTLRLETAFADARVHLWSAAAQGDKGTGTATFRAATSDGGIAWVTVTATAVVGAGYTGPASEIRCGTERSTQTEPAQRIAATCELGPTASRTLVPTTFTIDRSVFPWRSVTLDPNPDLIVDGDGSAVGAAALSRRANDGTGDLDVRIGGIAEFEATHYQFQPNGDLELARRPSRQPGIGDIICRRVP